MSITTIITTNKDDNFESTIESVKFDSKFLVCGDIKSSNKWKAVNLTGTNAEIRNKLSDLVETKYIFHMYAGELFILGENEFTKDVVQVEVVRNNSISKEIRFWEKIKKLKFVNPVYETVDYRVSITSPVLIAGIFKEEKLEDIIKWKKDFPFLSDPVYYEAFYHLSKQNYEDFVKCAEQYLFTKNKGISSIMMNFYYATIQFVIYKNYKKSIKCVLECIGIRPHMAEFWCLLGDIFYDLKKYEKSIEFYDNALIIGKKRNRYDDWPLEINKYFEYPNLMKANCQELLRSNIYRI